MWFWSSLSCSRAILRYVVLELFVMFRENIEVWGSGVYFLSYSGKMPRYAVMDIVFLSCSWGTPRFVLCHVKGDTGLCSSGVCSLSYSKGTLRYEVQVFVLCHDQMGY